jgi:molybdenum cofactor synthesis domain-containing protein
VRVGVLTVSDRAAAGERPDSSGPRLVERLGELGWPVVCQAILPDDQVRLEQLLVEWSDAGEAELILTTGGTGFAGRDRTPEATLRVVDRAAPGLAEAMRSASLRTTPHAMLSRAVAGIRGRCLIVNLPGNPKAALENLAVIEPALPHAIALLQDPGAAEAGHIPQAPVTRA